MTFQEQADRVAEQETIAYGLLWFPVAIVLFLVLLNLACAGISAGGDAVTARFALAPHALEAYLLCAFYALGAVGYVVDRLRRPRVRRMSEAELTLGCWEATFPGQPFPGRSNSSNP
jgi:hypothetical protein